MRTFHLYEKTLKVSYLGHRVTSKVLMCSFLLFFLVVFSRHAYCQSVAKPTQEQNVSEISLTKLALTPVKVLNSILKKTYSVQQGLPVYSYKKKQSFIQEKPSAVSTSLMSTDVKKVYFEQLQRLKQEQVKESEKLKISSSKPNPDIVQPIPPSVKESPPLKPQPKKQYTYDYSNVETSVVTLQINNKLAYDFEIIHWPSGVVSVPIKTLAELLDISVKQNHVNKNLSFSQPGTSNIVEIDHATSQIRVANNFIDVTKPKLIKIEEGFIVSNDIFVPQEIAQEILDIQTSFEEASYILDLDTTRTLKAMVRVDEAATEEDFFVLEEDVHEIDSEMKQNKWFSLKQLDYSMGSTFNQSNTPGFASNSLGMNGGFNAIGNFLGGEYTVGTTTTYSQDGMQVSNYKASLDYVNGYGELSLGATNTRLSELVTPGVSIWGARAGSLGAADGTSTIPRLIQGEARDNSLVELYINDVYVDKQAVVNRRYEFDSLNYPSTSAVALRVDEVGPDGARKVIYDRHFSNNVNLLGRGQSQFLLFSGVDSSSISNSYTLFGQSVLERAVQPIYMVSGAKLKMGITEKLTAGINIADGQIIRNPDSRFFRDFRQVSSARFFRSSRTSHGRTISLEADYIPFNKLKIGTEAAFSFSNSEFSPDHDADGTDFGGVVDFDIQSKAFSLNTRYFTYGPNFFSPGASSLIDRRGFEVTSGWKIQGVNFFGGVTRYNSNLDNFFSGGQSTILDYNFNLSGRIDDYSTMRAGVRSLGASNANLTDRDTTFDLTINRQLTSRANLSVNYTRAKRKSEDKVRKETLSNTNNRINAEFSYDSDKLGVIRLSHEEILLDPITSFVENTILDPIVEPVSSKNIRLTLDRTNKPLKGFIISPNIGYRYGGDNKGLIFGVNVGYQFKSGQQISLTYAFNSNFSRFLPFALNIGQNSNHTIAFNLSHSLGLGVPRGDRANNTYQANFDPNTGIVKGTVFLDLNQNGIRDEGEEGLPEVDIKFQNLFSVTSDGKGNYITTNVPRGLRKVGIDRETLPVIYSPTVADALINVKPGKVYRANLGVIVTPGSVSGKIIVEKEAGEKQDIIVSLYDMAGNEVKYTTTDSVGGFYISSIPPGEYYLAVDQNYLDYKGLQDSADNKHMISIPLVTDDFVDVEGLNISLIPKKGTIKRF